MRQLKSILSFLFTIINSNKGFHIVFKQPFLWGKKDNEKHLFITSNICNTPISIKWTQTYMQPKFTTLNSLTDSGKRGHMTSG